MPGYGWQSTHISSVMPKFQTPFHLNQGMLATHSEPEDRSQRWREKREKKREERRTDKREREKR